MLSAKVIARITTLVIAMASVSFATSRAAEMDILIDGVPLPADAKPVPLDASASPFTGAWVGTWDGSLKTMLVVEAISDDGKAKVVYAVADNPKAGLKGAWFRYDAEIVDSTMTMFGKRLTITFELSETGRLKAVLGDGFGFGVLTRHNLETIRTPDAKIIWTSGISEFLKTSFVEDEEPVSLETVIFKPSGKGPFPLAVVSHGSTGGGDDTVAFTETWTNPWFAEIMNERGWIVAFPQRRGRGKSGGLYDEGFAADRSEGYTFDADRSLAGADRALDDLKIAIDALRQRPDVSAEPILLAGNSRGGILSIAYAGLNPARIKGVINFVGGWISDNSDTADEINQTLFNKGADFSRPTLWLYGRDDVFYSMDHSRKNFEAFQKAGGVGEFFETSVGGENNGHYVMAIPPLWDDYVSKYLDAIE